MPKRKRPVLGVDYIIDTDGKAEFTPEFLLKRGYCCEHDCRFCPFITAHGGSERERTADACVSAGSLAVIDQ